MMRRCGILLLFCLVIVDRASAWKLPKRNKVAKELEVETVHYKRGCTREMESEKRCVYYDNPCLPRNPCLSNQTCSSPYDGTYNCTCTNPLYTGEYCEIFKDPCNTDACPFPYECISDPESGTYECMCHKSLYTGDTCDKPVCTVTGVVCGPLGVSYIFFDNTDVIWRLEKQYTINPNVKRADVFPDLDYFPDALYTFGSDVVFVKGDELDIHSCNWTCCVRRKGYPMATSVVFNMPPDVNPTRMSAPVAYMAQHILGQTAGKNQPLICSGDNALSFEQDLFDAHDLVEEGKEAGSVDATVQVGNGQQVDAVFDYMGSMYMTIGYKLFCYESPTSVKYIGEICTPCHGITEEDGRQPWMLEKDDDDDEDVDVPQDDHNDGGDR